MKLTKKLTRETYQKAQRELRSALRSRTAADEQKREAAEALVELNRRFIRQTVDSLEARTRQFQQFIDLMTRTIDQIERRGGPFDALKRLKKLVDGANDILNDNDDDDD